MTDLVSIIMPSFQTGDCLDSTIRSVLAQSYENWELIIVDDASTDETDKVVEGFLSDPRIRYFKNENNCGAALSRNRALREARGRWIAFLDSDDLWLPEKLEKQIAFMEKKGCAFSYTDYQILSPSGEMLPYIFTAPNRINKTKMYCYCYFSTITVMYDANVVGLIQIPDIKKNNDYAMWLKAVEKTDCYRLPLCLSIYRKREGSISSGSKIKLIRYHYILFRETLGKSKFTAFFLTGVNLFFGVLRKLFYKKKIKG